MIANRRTYFLFVLSFALLIGRPHPLHGQNAPVQQTHQASKLTPEQLQELNRLNDGGQVASDKGDFVAAMKAYQTGLEKADTLKDDDWTSTFLHKIGNVYGSQGKYDKALEVFHRVLYLDEKVGKEEDIARSLNSIGLVHHSLGHETEALEFYQKALTLREKLGNAKDIAYSYSNIGEIYHNQGKQDIALDYQQRALKLFEKIGNEQGIAYILSSIGSIYSGLDKHEQAMEFYQRALNIYEKLGHGYDVALDLRAIGGEYEEMGLYEKALDYEQRALGVIEAVGNEQYIAANLNIIGAIYSNLGQYDKAMELYQKALKLRENIGNSKEIASSINNIALVYYYRGSYEKALDFHQKALTLYEKIGNEQDMAASLNNIGLIYEAIGQYDKALQFYQKALKLREKAGDEQDIAGSLGNIAGLAEILGQHENALALTLAALEYFKKHGNDSYTAHSLNNAGNICESLGQYDRALDFLQQGLILQQKIGNQQDIAATLNNIGVIYTSLKQYDKALDFHLKSLAIRETLDNELHNAVSLSNIGYVSDKLGHSEQALDYYARAVQKMESLGLQVGDPTRLVDLQDTLPHLYERYALTLYHLNRPSEVLLTLERGKGQGLARQMRLNDSDLSFLFQPNEAEELKHLADDLTKNEKLLQIAQKRADAADKPEQRALFQKAVAEYKPKFTQSEQQYQLLRDALFARYPRFKELRVVEPPTNAQLLALGRRNPDTLFLQWAIVDTTETLLASLDKLGVQTFLLPIGSKELGPRIQTWRDALTTSSGQPERMKDEIQQAKELFSTLFGPLVKAGMLAPGKYKRLVLVGSGRMLDVPLGALMDGSGKRLIDRFAVSTALSFGILNKSDSYRDPTASFFCIADPLGLKPTQEELQHTYLRAGEGPLPGARQEGKTLTQLFPKSKLLIGSEAKEATLDNEIGKYALLHFATHGYLESKDPLRSGLILATEPEGSSFNGLLTGRKIIALPLSAQLAVLSACETGRGQIRGGEGLQGLAWAFRAAGCPAIVASHWKVDDATTRTLMVAFYKQLKAGKRKDEALRAAMLLVKKDKPAPYYWAAFQLIGDTKSISLP